MGRVVLIGSALYNVTVVGTVAPLGQITNSAPKPSVPAHFRFARVAPVLKIRNNWLFYGSDKGGRTGAVLSTLIASCKRLRIEPFAYLRDLFTRISAHPHQRLDELLPDKWLIAQRNASNA